MKLDHQKQKFLGYCFGRPIRNVLTGKTVETYSLGELMQCLSEDNDIRPVFKSLKDISDQDFDEFFFKFGWYNPSFQTIYKREKSDYGQWMYTKWKYKDKTKYGKYYLSPNNTEEYQFLWDRGYALPWFGLSVKDLEEVKYIVVE